LRAVPLKLELDENAGKRKTGEQKLSAYLLFVLSRFYFFRPGDNVGWLPLLREICQK